MKTATIATAIAVLAVMMSGCACGPGGGCGPCGGAAIGGCGPMNSGGNCSGTCGVGGGCGGQIAGCAGVGAGGKLAGLIPGLGSGMAHNGLLSGVKGSLAEQARKNHYGPQAHYGAQPGPANGPPAPTVSYPYYTTRGPRDFLAARPPSIGP